MARQHSPGYPSMPLSKAISAVKKIFDADRQAPVDRAVAAKHIGYSGQSGASDKALASLAHYGLLEKAGKGETRVTQLAVDILHPDTTGQRRAALRQAGLKPGIFQEIYDRYEGRLPSEEALRSYLLRANFQNIAVNPVISSYSETFRYLEQEKAFESGGVEPETGEESETLDINQPQGETLFGGAKVGDFVQWEANGVLQLEKPMRVRLVSSDGQYVAVDGSETGIPMDQIIVERRAPEGRPQPPMFPMGIGELSMHDAALAVGETEWIANRVGKDTKVRLLVSGGEMGAKEIGKLIKLLKAQQAVLSDDDEDEDDE